MNLKNIGDIIATRILRLKDENEEHEREIHIRIGKPLPFQDSPDFYCPYQIIGVGSEKIKYAGGIDAIQAIQLALDRIGAELYNSKEAQSDQLRWEGDEKGDLGFPRIKE